METATHTAPAGAFRHEALLYAGHDDFIAAASAFIREGIDAGEPTLVVVARAKIDALRDELGDGAASVLFGDMADVGANPGRIIPAWQDFVDTHHGAPRLRGIGEPVWAERDPTALLECQRHEALINLAFDDGREWWLLCPYDTATLPTDVLAEAERSHPFVSESGLARSSVSFGGVHSYSTLDAPLDPAPADARALRFGPGSLRALRSLTSTEAARAGLLSARIADLVLAVNEVATNSLRHGGGRGGLRVWRRGGAVVCEVTDAGRLEHALVDRRRPGREAGDSRGLWLANQLCDLVQMRSSQAGTTVRLHMQRA